MNPQMTVACGISVLEVLLSAPKNDKANLGHVHYYKKGVTFHDDSFANVLWIFYYSRSKLSRVCRTWCNIPPFDF